MADIEENLGAARPSGDPVFAEKVRRLIRPAALMKNEPLFWNPGIGTDVWEMFCAAITGEVNTIRGLLDRNPALVRSGYEYRGPLAFAVRENQLDVAALLLERGADPMNSGTPDSLLQIARDRGYREMQALLEKTLAAGKGAVPKGGEIAAAIREYDLPRMRQLLNASPELVQAPDEGTNQPIHWAVMTRQIEAIDELLARGADINVRRSDGACPIQLTNGDYNFRGWRDVPPTVRTTPREVVAHLRSRGAYCDICTAAHIGDVARVLQLLDEDRSLANRPSEYVSYYACSGTPLRNAAAAGHLEIVKLLLECGADPNLPEEQIAPRGLALYSAVANRHYEIAQLLLAHGAHANAEVDSSADTVSRAIMNGDLKMLKILATHGAIWDIGVDSPLSYPEIVASGIGRSVRILAAHGDIETAAARFAEDPVLADDPEALKNAVGGGYEEFVHLLHRYQPDLARRVTAAGPREMTKLLFTHGMDPSRPDWLRITPLHRFAEFGDLENAALYIEHGADLNARDEEFRSTPLGYAAKYGQARMVEFLLRRGARATLADDPPWATPLAWATARGHHEIVRLLNQFAQSGALPARSLGHYEQLARDLVAAYGSGDDTALRRIMDHFRIEHLLTWDRPAQAVKIRRLRRVIRGRLHIRSGEEAENETLALADAQLLIARSWGYEDWIRLATDVKG